MLSDNLSNLASFRPQGSACRQVSRSLSEPASFEELRARFWPDQPQSDTDQACLSELFAQKYCCLSQGLVSYLSLPRTAGPLEPTSTLDANWLHPLPAPRWWSSRLDIRAECSHRLARLVLATPPWSQGSCWCASLLLKLCILGTSGAIGPK